MNSKRSYAEYPTLKPIYCLLHRTPRDTLPARCLSGNAAGLTELEGRTGGPRVATFGRSRELGQDRENPLQINLFGEIYE